MNSVQRDMSHHGMPLCFLETHAYFRAFMLAIHDLVGKYLG